MHKKYLNRQVALLFVLIFPITALHSVLASNNLDSKTVTLWEPYPEWSLSNSSWSGNAFDLIATATFTHESGEVITTGMFFADNDTWKFRFTGTKTGLWSFNTNSTDPELNGHTGTITVLENSDENTYGFTTGVGTKWIRPPGNSGDLQTFVPNFHEIYFAVVARGETQVLDLQTNNPLATTATPESSEVELYNTFTLNLNRSDITSNKFAEFPQVTFSKGAKSLLVEGFYYGDDSGTADGDNWKVRFMPDETGIWSYSWNFNGDTGTGTFNVTAQSNNLVRGHIKRAGRFLVADDGKGFLYRGSNWPDTRRYRVNENDAPQILLSSTDWVNYVTRLSDTNHNGTYMSAMDRLVNDDGLSFDLAWIEKIDFALEEAGARGIYVFLGIFNTWTRSSTDPFVTVTNSSDQILDPWNNNLMAQKEFYIRYLAARFAGYYNTLWELGNEVGHSNSGNDFRDLANGYYIPWLRQYDPYDIPITLSENEFRQIDVEIGGFHQAQTIGLNETMPIIHTELVRVSGATGVLWKGISCRNTANRRYYRRTSWKGFIEGGSGSIECSLPFSGESPFLSMDDFLAHPDIRNVMDDHGRLGTAIDSFNNDITDLIPAPTAELGTSSVTFKLRRKADEEYVAYFWGGVGSGASISLNIPAGNYLAQWNSPATGLISSAQTVNNGDTIISPWSSEYDVMLRVYRDSGNLTTTTLNASSTLVSSGATVTLSWNSENTNSCVASGGWSGSRLVSGNEISPAISSATTFTLNCTGDTGSSSDSVTVNIDNGGAISLGSGVIITNALVYDENNGNNWSIQNNLQPGDVIYGDRSYRYTQIPENLIGQEWLSTANNSRSFVGENLVAFTVSEDAVVFILHRDDISNKPEWLSDWADTNADVSNDEPQSYSVFSRSFSAGSLVSLGANGSTTSGMYVVVVAAANSNNDLIFSDNFE